MELTQEQKTKLKSCFKQNSIIDAFETESAENVVSHLICELDCAKSLLVQFHNKQVFDSISFFVQEGEWVNLSQIMRSLPKQIKRTIKDENVRSIIDTDADLVAKFMELSQKEKKAALESLK